MNITIHAACGCHTGKTRKNNEDNFCFNGKCLEHENHGLRNPAIAQFNPDNGVCFAVFDGMGGENFGAEASFAAARCMQKTEQSLKDFLLPERTHLERLCFQLDAAVAEEKAKLLTDHMGTTIVSLLFSGRYVYLCNVGDSRAYRLRSGEFQQLSVDHVEKRPGNAHRKAPLTQYLGLGSDEIQIKPHISKGEIQKGDMYLLCSDGLTDMLTNIEISSIMHSHPDADACVRNLISAALERGGRDNITAIVCSLM